ncbi:MAG: hypothetical protein A3G34_06030 [Candidatus Lindowbacteria bacterium RIFCSPLOWO2_12_FULL_62_27]|nr:MAG: hypothetical protein A3G34_06030 [Candidatus Lindowbacteria bacterium RIFCSPLOWO2_12_FULL_62_27]OGH57466.1 MAG: hypothetical protein A3I06_06465 [Candidatus Lindowbacteria bacterium RIFCSPLOWO2_02_FULL_62_12]
MKRATFLLVGLAALFMVTGGWASEYEIDASHSAVMFKVKHLGISTVTGRFEKFSGSFDFDTADIPASKASAVIEVAGINTGVEKRDEHLRSADFFHADSYPQMAFVSKEVTRAEGEGFQIAGDLTLHGVTRPVTLDVEIGGMVTDMSGKDRAAFTATTSIHRKDFGLTWSKMLETGGLVVGETVRIILEIEGIRKKETK